MILPMLALALAIEPARTPLAEYERREFAGFVVLVHPEAPSVAEHARVLAALANDLDLSLRLVPEPARDHLRRVVIVVSPTTAPAIGFSGRGMCYHESADWLEGAGFDREREGTIEICSMADFLAWRAEQPAMVLHELAHAYHAALGFDRPEILKVHESARAGGSYERVPHALRPEPARAYALTNHKEYFAELSESLWWRNDFFPFTRDELTRHDPEGARVVEAAWMLDTNPPAISPP